MNVASNTSPLTNLAAIGQFDLLHRLYGRLFIAEEVRNTLPVETLRRDLGQGEAETITLATKLSADLLLMDEREGRHAAQRLGLMNCRSRRPPPMRSAFKLTFKHINH